MAQLLQVRSTVLGLLEQARGRRCVVLSVVIFRQLNGNIRQLSSSTEAEVDIILPGVETDLTRLIMREGQFPIYLNAPLFTVFFCRIFPEDFVHRFSSIRNR